MRHTLWKMKMRLSFLYMGGEDGLLPVWSGGGWDVRRVTQIHVVQGGVCSWGWWWVQDLKRASRVYSKFPLAKPPLQLASLGSGALFSAHGPQTSLELVNLERRETSAIFPRADGGRRHGDKVLSTLLSLSLSGITLLASREPSGPQPDLGHEHQEGCQQEPWSPPLAPIVSTCPYTPLCFLRNFMLTALGFHSCTSCHCL